METEKLIATLSQDAGRPPQSLAQVLLFAGIAASIIAFGAFALFVGPRGDLASALHTPRFVLKPVLTILLFVIAFSGLSVAMRPGADARASGFALALPAAMLGIAVMTELALVPPALWTDRLVGSNAILCLTVIPALAVGPLLVFLWTLRQGAPTHPTRSGALAGLAAAALAATFYAFNCTDDSPLFVATWYPVATAIVVAFGAFAGRVWVRW